MKKTYIVPTLDITKLTVENMIAVSGPGTTEVPADQQAGMEVKTGRNDYNVWDIDWSK